MMVRRWFRVEWPGTIWDLATRLKNRAYETSTNEGFLLDRVRDQALQARFIERIDNKYRGLDPFGCEVEGHRVEYRQVAFCAYVDFPQLELIDPPKDSQTFTSRMAEIHRFSVSFSPLTIDLLKWADRIQKLLDVRTLITSLSISEFEMKAGVTGAVRLRGQYNVQKALGMLTGKEHLLAKLEISFPGIPDTRLILYRSATAMFDGEVPRDLIAHMHESLQGLS
jgi:hypothetical protein